MNGNPMCPSDTRTGKQRVPWERTRLYAPTQAHTRLSGAPRTLVFPRRVARRTTDETRRATRRGNKALDTQTGKQPRQNKEKVKR
jgi:hypothetical protein